MKITVRFVEKLGKMYNQKPCTDGYDWFVENFSKGGNNEDIFQKAIDDGVIGYCTWALAFSMPKEKNVEWAIWCAEQVLPIFEEKYPNDDRPRKAIKAAKAWLKNPCDESAALAERSARSATWAARSATEAETAEAAEAGMWAAFATNGEAFPAINTATASVNASHKLSMQILQKGFEIWRRK